MLKVLLIDPSRDFRETLKHGLETAEDVTVVAAVADKESALGVLERQRPDVAVFDVEMPGALDTLRSIQQRNEVSPEEGHVGVVLIAKRKQRDAERTIQALETGAFDFVLMPESDDMSMVLQSLCRQLFVKMRNYSSKRIFSSMAASSRAAQQASPSRKFEEEIVQGGKIRAILVGISTGGPKALSSILPRLCTLTDLPICVVQHMPPNFTASLSSSLNGKCAHAVGEAVDGEPLKKGRIYIAPGGKHLYFSRNENGVCLRLGDDPPEEGCRPSVNVMFRSAAKVLRGDVVALVLTGMGSDGAKGLLELKNAGAYVIAQDKATSVVWGMPGSAVATGCVDRILPLDDIPEAVVEALRGNGNGA